MEMIQEVRLISLTEPVIQVDEQAEMTPEGLIAYCARVSSNYQDSPEYAKLLRYCANHGHWSIFEMADMAVEIITTRGIAAQILRHRSFNFQEFSQRYAKSTGFISAEARRQDVKNRQNSINDMSEDTKEWFINTQKELADAAFAAYEVALEKGIAKECARFLLPLSTSTKLYMKGSIRSWLHYIQVRTDPSTQKEHREIALKCKNILCEKFPLVATAMEWV